MFTEVFPIVAVADMTRALGFYRDALGGTVTHDFAGADGLPAYVGIDIGSSHMGLALAPGPIGDQRPIRIWIYADNCDAAVERLSAMGVQILESPQDRPYGERVARVLDPDGNEVIIGQRGPGSRGAREVGESLISPEPERYTRPEYERRFLVRPGSDWRNVVEPYSKRLEDCYLRHTRLRLRVLSDSKSGLEFLKLTKKLESNSAYVQMIGSIPLSPMEYEFLSNLQGERIRKVRHYHFYRGHVFSIDVFEDDLAGLVMCEVETGSLEELMRIEVPDYVLTEVTEDPFFTGANLSRVSRNELVDKLAATGISLSVESPG